MITFEIEMTKKEIGKFSLNKLYSTNMHWSKRKQIADYIHNLTHYTLLQNKIPRKLFKRPIEVNMYFNSNLDIDGHGLLSKLIIDGLKGYLVEDDSRKYINKITQEFWNGKGIKVEIIEEEVK